MSMRTLEKLRDMLCDELDEYKDKTKLSAGDLEIVHKLTDTVKNIDKICIMDEDGEYSQAGDWEAMGRGRFGDYERGNSYAGRRCDSMGLYSREGRGVDYSRARGGRGRYSREGGDGLMEHVEKMMDEAETPKEREAIKRFKKELEGIM